MTTVATLLDVECHRCTTRFRLDAGQVAHRATSERAADGTPRLRVLVPCPACHATVVVIVTVAA